MIRLIIRENWLAALGFALGIGFVILFASQSRPHHEPSSWSCLLVVFMFFACTGFGMILERFDREIRRRQARGEFDRTGKEQLR